MSTLPGQVPGLSGITVVAAGEDNSAAVKDDGTVWVWGSNSWGQLGNVIYLSSSAPVQVVGLSDVISITAGSGYFFASKT
jgi:alpha-tubulin suppressor-like RCC1 family protein